MLGENRVGECGFFFLLFFYLILDLLRKIIKILEIFLGLESSRMEPEDKKKVDYELYGLNMRKALSNEELVTKNGEINHEYFLRKKGAYFGPKEHEALLEAIKGDEAPYDIKHIKSICHLLEKFVSQNFQFFTLLV